MMACVDWLMSGILERHPAMKVILSEGGAGWLPYILERADKAFHDQRIRPNARIGQTSKGERSRPASCSATTCTCVSSTSTSPSVAR